MPKSQITKKMLSSGNRKNLSLSVHNARYNKIYMQDDVKIYAATENKPSRQNYEKYRNLICEAHDNKRNKTDTNKTDIDNNTEKNTDTLKELNKPKNKNTARLEREEQFRRHYMIKKEIEQEKQKFLSDLQKWHSENTIKSYFVERDGKVIAFAILRKSQEPDPYNQYEVTMILDLIYVSINYRRRGLASKMLSAIKQENTFITVSLTPEVSALFQKNNLKSMGKIGPDGNKIDENKIESPSFILEKNIKQDLGSNLEKTGNNQLTHNLPSDQDTPNSLIKTNTIDLTLEEETKIDEILMEIFKFP